MTDEAKIIGDGSCQLPFYRWRNRASSRVVSTTESEEMAVPRDDTKLFGASGLVGSVKRNPPELHVLEHTTAQFKSEYKRRPLISRSRMPPITRALAFSL
jgi:hypothetical protein